MGESDRPENPVLALLADLSDERSVIDRAAAKFGWTTAVCQGRDDFAALCEQAWVIGVVLPVHDCLTDDTCGWARRAWSRGTRVRPLICWRAAQRLSDDALPHMGGYDAWMRPLRADEVISSLGFLAQAVARESNGSLPKTARPPGSRMDLVTRRSDRAVSVA